MSEYKVSEIIKKLKPYKPGQSEEDVKAQYQRDFFVKLASNESPLKPSDSVLQAVQKAASDCQLYPDPLCRDLRNEASRYYQVPAENILVGNGSNELIDLLIRLFCEAGESVLTSKAAFIAYKVCAGASRVLVDEVDLNADLSISIEAFDERLKELDSLGKLPKLVFIPNPNNPTGSYINKKSLDAFMSTWGGRNDLIIVLDEAYTEFVEALDFPDSKDYYRYSNFVCLKTMSKVFGMAGFRLGFLIGPEKILDLVHRIRNPFNVNSVAQAAGVAALKDKASLEKVKEMILKERKAFSKVLTDLGLSFVPSQANFILFQTPKEAIKVHDELLREGVIARPLAPYGFDCHLRITIGDKEQMSFAEDVFRKVFS